MFQIIGTKLINFLTNQNINDSTSGFRLYNKKCFSGYFYIENTFSYSLETLILFSWKQIRIESENIKTNKDVLRPSRLFRNNWEYISKQTTVILDSFNKFYPFKFFSIISLVLFLPGFLISLRFLFYYMSGISGHTQSLIFSAILIISSILSLSMAVLSSSLSKIRIILEKNTQQDNVISFEILELKI